MAPLIKAFLFMVLLLSAITNAFYTTFTDSSGTSSYLTHTSAITQDSFDLLVYCYSPYTIIFNGTLKTFNLSLSQQSMTFLIKSNILYIFIQCPLSLTISISFPLHNIQYTQHHNPANTNGEEKYRCIYQHHDQPLNSIHSIMYSHSLHQISHYRYDSNLQINVLQQHIPPPFNYSNSSYIVYHENTLYLVSLSSHHFLQIASYNLTNKDKSAGRISTNNQIFLDIVFPPDMVLQYAGIRLTRNSRLPVLNIFLYSHSKYQIVSYLIDTDIYSIHEYTANTHNDSIVINDGSIHIILPSYLQQQHFVFYDDMNAFLEQLSFSGQYMQISHTKRRRLSKTDPECQDVSTNCPLIANDCDDEGIKDLCRQTCGQCKDSLVFSFMFSFNLLTLFHRLCI